jgi:hypothetical protein
LEYRGVLKYRGGYWNIQKLQWMANLMWGTSRGARGPGALAPGHSTSALDAPQLPWVLGGVAVASARRSRKEHGCASGPYPRNPAMRVGVAPCFRPHIFMIPI